VLTEVIKGVYMWQALELELKRHINGYVFMTRIGPIMVDPPSAAEVILKDIEALGKPRAIILTGRRQQRRSKQYQGWYKAKLFAPEGDRKLLTIRADHFYRGGESLPGGFKSISLPDQRSPGETALYHEKLGVMVCSHLVCTKAGYVQMQDQGLYWNFSRAFEAQLTLLDYPFETLLPGRGTPIVKEASMGLAKFLAGFEPGAAI